MTLKELYFNTLILSVYMDLAYLLPSNIVLFFQLNKLQNIKLCSIYASKRNRRTTGLAHYNINALYKHFRTLYTFKMVILKNK